MRAAILFLVLLVATGVVFAGEGLGSHSLRLNLREFVGVISFGALAGMLFWHFRK